MTTREPLAGEVRYAAPADVDPLAIAFARAFYDDPLMTWVVPDDTTRLDRLQCFFRHGLARMVRTGVRDVFVTADVAGGATWARPGAWKLPARSMLPGVPGMLRAIGHGGLMRIARAYTFLQSKHPHEPHWYLEGIATDPAQQRHGVGSALLSAMLRNCDHEGIPAYLETQNPDNVPFYARHGFEVVDDIDLPAHGPHMWLMWREPRGPAS